MRTTYRLTVPLALALALSACSSSPNNAAGRDAAPRRARETTYAGTVQLYGETHAVKEILDKEIEIWIGYYERGNRSLFIELPYYTAEYLNTWMKAPNDAILDAIFADWEGTSAHNPDTYAFYKTIKRECPETVFHGTDVGHQYASTGARFLLDLEAQGLADSERYRLAKETVAQGAEYYRERDPLYRENAMVANFLREAEGIQDSCIVGFYGSAHVGLYNLDYTGQIPCMANQLRTVFNAAISSTDLRYLTKPTTPLRVDTIKAGDGEYPANYFGKQPLYGFRDFSYREFWRLEGAYEALKDNKKIPDYLPFDNYPMQLGPREVYVIDYTGMDGSTQRHYYRNDGDTRNGEPITMRIRID